MKKYLFIATAAITVLAGCNKFSFTPDQNNQVEIDDTTPAYIQLGTQLPEVAVKTKAAVTGTAFNDGETVTVIGKVTGAEGTGAALAEGVTNASFVEDATTADSKLTLTTNHTYVDGQLYSFYAYYEGRVGGGVATITDPTAPATDDLSAVAVELPTTADADVMAAKANPDTDWTNASGGGSFEGKGMTAENYSKYVYGAKAARRGINPSLKFNHLLTSLDVQLKAGNADAKNLVVDSISVDASLVGEIDFTVTPITATSTGTPAAVYFATPSPDYKPGDTYASFSTPLLLFPNAGSYTISVKFRGIDTPVTGEFTSPEEFLAGKTYIAQMIVYGPANISITTSITDWTTGNTIPEYDPDAIL